MNSTHSLLGRINNTISNMLKAGVNSHMCYLILFAALILFLVAKLLL